MLLWTKFDGKRWKSTAVTTILWFVNTVSLSMLWQMQWNHRCERLLFSWVKIAAANYSYFETNHEASINPCTLNPLRYMGIRQLSMWSPVTTHQIYAPGTCASFLMRSVGYVCLCRRPEPCMWRGVPYSRFRRDTNKSLPGKLLAYLDKTSEPNIINHETQHFCQISRTKYGEAN